MFKKKQSIQFHTKTARKKKMGRKTRIWLFAILFVLVLVGGATYFFLPHVQKTVQKQMLGDEAPVTLKVDAKSAMVVDLSTGQVLGEKNVNKQVAIASQSKMLVAYGVLKGIESKKITWNSQVTIPASADLSSQNSNEFSHLEIKKGDKVSVRDLYWAMFTNSANDAAFALTSYMTPTGQTSQSTLQGWAKELNLKESDWYNGAGQKNGDAFDNQVKSASANAYNSASASQVAQIARAVVEMDPSLKKLTNNANLVYTKNSRTKASVSSGFGSEFRQIQANLDNENDLTMLGLKTGSTPESGGCFTGIVKDKNGHLFLTVINGAGSYTDNQKRFQGTIDIVDQVLSDMVPHDYKAGSTIKGSEALAIKDSKVKAKVQVATNKTYWNRSKDDLTLDKAPTLKKAPDASDTKVLATLGVQMKGEFLPGTTKAEKGIGLELQGQPVPEDD
ncbi:D-alanyl-D-alanine carboxypeptidase [Fructobacillus sp. M2-14]|uniref:D-alanyl-D-alanine carboxypeptidase n=1 Tax=Fructobacillus broussonetiae TaxID=2713173 RepID=A0ABS5R0J8_9LACO|nr:serine hydrolase [Fructobacillus broussonetiae]MBS9338737.1 D-alanyl-D-alanine carboxypeptidase [Fructobacillus broussonetiae]